MCSDASFLSKKLVSCGAAFLLWELLQANLAIRHFRVCSHASRLVSFRRLRFLWAFKFLMSSYVPPPATSTDL